MALVLTLLLVGSLLWQIAHRDLSIAPPAIAVVACLIWCAGFLQTIELPSEFVRWLSPASASAYVDLVPESIRAEAADMTGNASDVSFIPISVAPELTRMSLAIPASFAVAAWLSSLCFRQPQTGMLFLLVIGIVGGLFAFFGLADAVLLTQPGTLERWDRLVITPTGTQSAFGPFVNNNNGGGFFNLAIGCALGAVVFLVRGRESKAIPPLQDDDAHATGSTRLTIRTVLLSCLLAVCVLALLSLIAGIFASKSRGAFVGLVAGTLCLSIVVLRSGVRSRLVLMLSGLGCASCIVLVAIGLMSRFRGRIRTLWTGDALEDPRLAHWKDSFAAAVEYFPAGAGLGSYRYAYLPYQNESGGAWFLHADGMPFEWLLEGGLWLLPLVVIGLAFVTRDLFRIANQTQSTTGKRSRSSEAFLLAAVFALPALIVSQCFDYGILQPPLLLTTACLCGGIAGLATPLPAAEASNARTLQAPSSALPLRMLFPAAAGVGLCLGMVLAASDLHVGSTVERAQRNRIVSSRKRPGESSSLQSDIGRIHLLSRLHPKDASLRLLLAQLILDEQRRLGAIFLLENKLATAKTANTIVSPRALRRACNGGDVQRSIEELMLPGQDVENWKAARGHAAVALSHRPLDDAARVLLVELDMLDESFAAVSPELIDQVKQLRRRSKRALHSLSRL